MWTTTGTSSGCFDPLLASPLCSADATSDRGWLSAVTRAIARPWTHDELVVAFNLYCELPFGRLHQRAPEVERLAALLARSPGSVAMKLVNIASLDPAVTASGRRGLGNASVADAAVWSEFHADWEGLALESARIRQQLADAHGLPDAIVVGDDVPLDDHSAAYAGISRPAVVQMRVKQAFFRKAVLASYEGRCCVTGLSARRLLVASHIVPWAADPKNRLNPRNGLCLSSLHDKAFDAGLMTLSGDHRVVMSQAAKSLAEEPFALSSLLAYDGQKIRLPVKFAPDEAFLAHHRTSVFLG